MRLIKMVINQMILKRTQVKGGKIKLAAAAAAVAVSQVTRQEFFCKNH